MLARQYWSSSRLAPAVADDPPSPRSDQSEAVVIDGRGPQGAYVVIEELPGTPSDGVTFVCGVDGADRRVGRGQRAAEVRDGPRRVGRGPVLCREEMGHRGPRVERLDEATDRGASGSGPAEGGLVLVQPELQGLGGDRSEVVDHGPPCRGPLDELRADVPDHAEGDAEDDDVEVPTDLEGPPSGVPARRPEGFEVHVHPGTGRAELVVERAARPARQALHPDEGVVVRDTFGEVGLDAELDGRDGPTVLAQAESVDAVEEAEFDTPVPQHLVTGGRRSPRPSPPASSRTGLRGSPSASSWRAAVRARR